MLIDVHFRWDDEHGECYDCGLPAAFAQRDAYGERPLHPLRDEEKLCAVCAANAAAAGERIWRIDEITEEVNA